MDLREELIKVFENGFTVAQYKRYERWVMTHIDRICDGYNGMNWDWLKIGGKVYFKAHGDVTEAKFEGFIVNTSYVGFKTSMGNVWYFEAFKTKGEAEKSKDVITDY